MSRIGKLPVIIPDGVEVTLDGSQITVKGPKGTLTRALHQDMLIEVTDKEVLVKRPTDEKPHRALHGLTRSLVANMVEGVTKGFEKNLEITGVGYRATKQGDKLVLSVGYSHPVQMDPPSGLEIEVPIPTKISVKGIDKEVVGQFAANIRAVRKPEPYLGKGIRYEGERVRRKAGKAGKVSRA